MPSHQDQGDGVGGKEEAEKKPKIDSGRKLKGHKQHARGAGAQALPCEEPVQRQHRWRDPEPVDELRVAELGGHRKGEGK